MVELVDTQDLGVLLTGERVAPCELENLSAPSVMKDVESLKFGETSVKTWQSRAKRINFDVKV